jgi:hypothetical protein
MKISNGAYTLNVNPNPDWRTTYFYADLIVNLSYSTIKSYTTYSYSTVSQA